MHIKAIQLELKQCLFPYRLILTRMKTNSHRYQHNTTPPPLQFLTTSVYLIHNQMDELLMTPVHQTSRVITPEEARAYVVPEHHVRIWKLLEAQLRKVGRSDARVSELSANLANECPSSWCFGGTTAPIYMCPFSDVLINIT